MASETVLKCYRGACQASAHPCGYNRITHGLYCLDCAAKINRGTDREPGGAFYPLLPYRREVTDGGAWRRGLVVVREVADGQ